MTIGDMFSNLTGFIRSLSFDWNYLGPGGKWEITQGLRIPMACTVSMNFTVMHDDMPDRNFALYPGPLGGGNGLIGERGESNVFPEGGPLIATAERSSNKGDLQFLQQEIDRGQMSEEEVDDLRMPMKRALQNRKQQYIDWVQDNRWVGTPTAMRGLAGEEDLVFD
jgi:hypothetical protein